MKKQHKIIFIDWHDTLSTDRFWHQWEDTHPERSRLIQDNFFGNDKETTVKWMRGELDAEDVTTILGERTSIPIDELRAELQSSSERLRLIDESVLNLIATIRDAGIKAVIATDNMDTFPRWTVPALKLDRHFDDILDSHTLKTLKDEAGEDGSSLFFHDYLAREGISPEQAVLFDDNGAFAPSFGIEYRQITEDKPLQTRLEEYINEQT